MPSRPNGPFRSWTTTPGAGRTTSPSPPRSFAGSACPTCSSGSTSSAPSSSPPAQPRTDVSDPLELRTELDAALDLAAAEAKEYLRDIGDAPVLDHASAEDLAGWSPAFPEEGDGALAALEELTSLASA